MFLYIYIIALFYNVIHFDRTYRLAHLFRGQMAAFHQMTYDVFIGRRGHISMSDVLAKLVNEEEGFDFMPDQGNEITAKIIDWFLVNRAGQACSIDELRPGHALYLHGQILSWSEQVRSYTIGNVRISEW